jgi:hypothetical protein
MRFADVAHGGLQKGGAWARGVVKRWIWGDYFTVGRCPPEQRAMPARSLRVCTCLQARSLQQRAHGLGLVVAVLQQQPAARHQVGGGLGNDGADVVQAIGTAGQGLQWFVLQGGQVRVGRADVGRVGHDGVERALQPLQPVPAAELHRQAQALGVGLGHGARASWLASTASTLGIGPLAAGPARWRRCPCPGPARAGRDGGQDFQGPVHQGFGVGAGVEHAGIHLQLQAVEGLGAR